MRKRVPQTKHLFKNSKKAYKLNKQQKQKQKLQQPGWDIYMKYSYVLYIV